MRILTWEGANSAVLRDTERDFWPLPISPLLVGLLARGITASFGAAGASPSGPQAVTCRVHGRSSHPIRWRLSTPSLFPTVAVATPFPQRCALPAAQRGILKGCVNAEGGVSS